MTTEIAVLNRLGVALAADSAVTISNGSETKVFDSADKLFELSTIHPVGVMINGNMNCLGIPWELLVKEYRVAHGDDQKPTLDAWRKELVTFIEAHLLVGDEAEKLYVETCVKREINRLGNQLGSATFDVIIEIFSSKKWDRVISILEKTLKDNSLEGLPQASSHGGYDKQDVVSRHGADIEEMVRASGILPQSLQGKFLSPVVDHLAKMLLSSRMSPDSTGVVIAGFGGGDSFPSMVSFEIDGRLLGKVRFNTKPHKMIDHVKRTGDVEYFAQTDVIQRLLGGVDPRFVRETQAYIDGAVRKALNAVLPKRKQRGRPPRDEIIDEFAREIAGLYEGEVAPNLSESLQLEFANMIAMMPKSELLEFAEALVEITAVERKATSDIGTVGGPIDVALITKHEGFIWVKRKHYFNAELNPRYFWRKYGQQGKSNDEKN